MRLNKHTLLLLFCFAAIYIVWGSTYLAIAYGIEDFGPWTLTALRFTFATLILYTFTIFKKEPALNLTEIRMGVLTGALLITANGIVCVSEKTIASGVVAIVIGAMPIWIMLVNWLIFRGARPATQKIIGAIIGLAGIALIVAGSSEGSSVNQFTAGAIILLLFCCLFWSSGTVLQKKISGLKSTFKFSSLQMLSGAVVAGIFAVTTEHPWHLAFLSVKPSSVLALAYLVTFGSVVSYTAYGWLARNVEPHKVSSYALVNPVVAVILGAIFRGESFNAHSLSALGLVLIGIFLLLFERRKKESLP
jgi:drug/metabolite transporter (DMT)-like permease